MFVSIQFAITSRKAFTYSVPEELVEAVKTGVRAVAPFGKRTLTGFVTEVHTHNPQQDTEIKIKPIYDILDSHQLYTNEDINFYSWLSEYYLCSLGEALRLAVPQGSDVESRKIIYVDQDFSLQLFQKEKRKDSLRGKILSTFINKKKISFSQLQKEVKKKNIHAVVRKLEEEGALSCIDENAKPKLKAKKIRCVKLAQPVQDIYDTIPEIERKSPKQVILLLQMIKQKNEIVKAADILKQTKSAQSTLDSLVQKGLLAYYEKEIERKYSLNYSETEKQITPSKDQINVINEVSKFIDEKKFSAFLLHGVTCSGKTQVYIELIKRALAKQQTALLLVPEISLTPQITFRLVSNFGEDVTVLHSKMSPGERFDSWKKVLNGKSKIVVGARSALFAPLKNIGVIIVDEEHDGSYKQSEMVPKYQARDCAVVRASIHNCPILLGSATPSVESMYNAQSGKYKLLKLEKRIDDARLPEITLINIIQEKKQKRMENIFSKTLLEKISDRLNKKEGVIILQNRRGFSTQIYCIECSMIVSCINCSVAMIYHIKENELRCHYCDYSTHVPRICSQCGSPNLKYFGAGTERVEDEIEYYFPNAKIERIDSDSVRNKGTLGDKLTRFSSGEIDILVGTQMVSKGLDFSRVTLVGVISAETTLWMPDFRADERTFQLLTQVAGRAGRSKTAGEVVVQTQNDQHFVLQKFLANDYFGFYEKELKDREETNYPPFYRLCLIEMKDKDDKKVLDAIKDFHRILKSYEKYVQVSAPTSAIIAKLNNFYRYQIIVRSSRKNDPGGATLRKIIFDSLSKFHATSLFGAIPLSIDIDPSDIL